jgi:hypothetical protein
MNTRIQLAAALTLAASLTAFADVKVNDHFSINGYAVGAYTHTDRQDGTPDLNSFFESKGSPGNVVNSDAVKLGVLGTSGALSGYASILYLPGAANEAGLLDAYATYDTGAGIKLTGGKFLSYLGYEAFDPINMAQLTYGSSIYAIPGYHSGVKADFSGAGFSAGVAVVDSIFHGRNGFFEGDRDFDDDVGIEAIVTYTGIDKLTVFAGIATENTDGATDDLFIFDLWASYAVSDKVTIAGEVDTQEDTGKGWLAFLSYKASDQFSTAFRVSGWKWDNALGGGDETKYTVAPTWTVSPNLAFRGEVSVGEGDSGDYRFYGVQAVLKW